jgi:hypothetical protein
LARGAYLDRANEDAGHAEVLRRLLMQMNEAEQQPEDEVEPVSLKPRSTGTGPK